MQEVYESQTHPGADHDQLNPSVTGVALHCLLQRILITPIKIDFDLYALLLQSLTGWKNRLASQSHLLLAGVLLPQCLRRDRGLCLRLWCHQVIPSPSQICHMASEWIMNEEDNLGPRFGNVLNVGDNLFGPVTSFQSTQG